MRGDVVSFGLVLAGFAGGIAVPYVIRATVRIRRFPAYWSARREERRERAILRTKLPPGTLIRVIAGDCRCAKAADGGVWSVRRFDVDSNEYVLERGTVGGPGGTDGAAAGASPPPSGLNWDCVYICAATQLEVVGGVAPPSSAIGRWEVRTRWSLLRGLLARHHAHKHGRRLPL